MYMNSMRLVTSPRSSQINPIVASFSVVSEIMTMYIGGAEPYFVKSDTYFIPCYAACLKDRREESGACFRFPS